MLFNFQGPLFLRSSVERSCSISYIFPFVNTFFKSFLNFFNIFSISFSNIRNIPYMVSNQKNNTICRRSIFIFFRFFFKKRSFPQKFAKNFWKIFEIIFNFFWKFLFHIKSSSWKNPLFRCIFSKRDENSSLFSSWSIRSFKPR